jgi:hypothetical protein
MDKILRKRGEWSFWVSRIALFFLAIVGWCSQSMNAAPKAKWENLTPQDTQDINALLPRLTFPGQGLWLQNRTNSGRVPEILQNHYNDRHGALGYHTITVSKFNGDDVEAIVGIDPVTAEKVVIATAEEVVMAKFIDTLGRNVPAGAMVWTENNGTRKIRIPVKNSYKIKVKEKKENLVRNAIYCMIMLPAVPPIPPGTPAGALAPPPTNVCSVFFAAS